MVVTMPEPSKTNPIRETTDEARLQARGLIENAQFASLAVLEAETGYPLVSRISVAMEKDGSPFFLASDLSGHSKALKHDPRASIMFGEPPEKGDPLAFPRVTVIGKVEKLDRDDALYPARRAFWLNKHPKAELYVDFGDFAFYKMSVERVALNGGFGKAFELRAEDIKGV
jgi:putative heme iron utilization protein